MKKSLSSAINLACEWSTNSKPEPAPPFKRCGHIVGEERGVTVAKSDAAWNAVSNVAGLGWKILSTPNNTEGLCRAEFVASPLVAEGLAMREAVKSCKDQDMRILRMKSDSAQLIKCLNSDSVVTELYSIVSDILAFASGFQSISFLWIPREKNMIADNLAKLALNFVDSVIVVDALNAPN